MNKTTVVAAVLTRLRSVQDARGAELGWPEPEANQHGSLPQFRIKVRPVQKWERITAGAGGTVQATYIIKIRGYLAKPTTKDSVVESIALPFDERVRTVFTDDTTLGGVCFYSELGPASDNLEIYKDAKEFAMIEWNLVVQEQTAGNATAAE